MNLLQALKTVGRAVGDGKIVPIQSYVKMAGGHVYATDGKMEATVGVDGYPPDEFCVKYDLLMRSLEREGASFSRPTDDNGLIVRAGRSRATLRGLPGDDFPHILRAGLASEVVHLSADDRLLTHQILKDMAPFCGSADNHIWQMGVHFRRGMAFAANPYGLIVHHNVGDVLANVTVPPWALSFILAQEQPFSTLGIRSNQHSYGFPDEVVLISTTLIETAPDYIVDFAYQLGSGTQARSFSDVPDNLVDALQRLKSYGAKTAKIGDGKVVHRSDEIDFEEDIDLHIPVRQWSIEFMLAALKFAERFDLTNGNAVWEGNGYMGAFAGMAD